MFTPPFEPVQAYAIDVMILHCYVHNYIRTHVFTSTWVRFEGGIKQTPQCHACIDMYVHVLTYISTWRRIGLELM